MPNLGELVEWTRHNLSGFDTSREAVSALSAAVAADDTTIPVEDVGGNGQGVVASRGIAEIGFELVRVKTVDPSTNSCLLYPFGRGYRGTVKAAHEAGEEVRFNPAFPASTVAREINGVLAEIYPTLYAVKAHETAFPASGGAISLPVDCKGVIGVYVADDVNTGQWVAENRWRWMPDSTSTTYSLRVGGQYRPGHGVRVVYAARPEAFDLGGSLTQDFTTVTGLDARLADLIQLGVACRMAPFFDMAKLPFLAAAPRNAGEAKAPGTGGNATRLLNALFKQRLDQEAMVLAKEHPIRVHRAGV